MMAIHDGHWSASSISLERCQQKQSKFCQLPAASFAADSRSSCPSVVVMVMISGYGLLVAVMLSGGGPKIRRGRWLHANRPLQRHPANHPQNGTSTSSASGLTGEAQNVIRRLVRRRAGTEDEPVVVPQSLEPVPT